MKPKIKTTCTKLQLQLLSFCLLCLSGKTRCDGNGPAVVTVEQDSDAVLPCSLSPKESIESYRFDWKKPAQIDGGQKEVFFYDAGVTYDSGRAGQSEEFKGRVSHFPEELKHGNAAITIRNTKVTDSGNYTCNFPDLQPPQTFHIKLVVGAAPKPNIRTLDQTDYWALLQCEANGHPQPQVEWRDSAGNKLPAEEPQFTERDGLFYVTLNTAVTKTDRYRCVATQKDISHQIHDETFVRFNVNSGSGANSSGSTERIVTEVAVVLLVLVVVILVLVVRRYHILLKRYKDSEKRKPLNDSETL